MGKQVLKRQRPDGLVTAGLPGYSIYIICSPLMLQHIEVFYTVRRDKTELELMAHIRGLNSINEKYAGIARLL